jgi:hypothetical protein
MRGHVYVRQLGRASQQTVFHSARTIGCSSTAAQRKASPSPSFTPIDPRWLSSVKERIGKCITFGLKSKQLDEAGNILQLLARDWQELLVGSEGFLTAPGRVGLDKQAVVWGEMVQVLIKGPKTSY